MRTEIQTSMVYLALKSTANDEKRTEI